MSARLIINTNKLKHNLDFLTSLCHANRLSVAVVTKVFCADERIVSVINDSDADYLADSRIKNLRRYPSSDKPKLLLRIATPAMADEVVACADISLQSEVSVIKALKAAAKQANKRHKVVLMIDLGDLREGIFFENTAEILAAAEEALTGDALELYGIGTNLTCYGGVLPDKKNLTVLTEIAQLLRDRFSVELPFVSGGNSSTIEFLRAGGVPKGITNLRLGESFVLGKDTAVCKVVEGMYGDAITLEAEIAELKVKPSKPIGTVGRNAFGEEVHHEDKGLMTRAIVEVGRQDVDEGGLYCMQNNITVIGASSDHLILDLTRAGVYNVGDTLSFMVDYGCMLRSFTSEFIDRDYI